MVQLGYNGTEKFSYLKGQDWRYCHVQSRGNAAEDRMGGVEGRLFEEENRRHEPPN